MKLTFVISAKEAADLRRETFKRISDTHTGINGSYEEGVIDAISWLLGDCENPFAELKPKRKSRGGR